MNIADVDLAAVGPCPGCGMPVRRMGGVPIAGTNLDPVVADRAWCGMCLKSRMVAAARDRSPADVLAELRGNLLAFLAGV